jgi:hypothetical protein
MVLQRSSDGNQRPLNIHPRGGQESQQRMRAAVKSEGLFRRADLRASTT